MKKRQPPPSLKGAALERWRQVAPSLAKRGPVDVDVHRASDHLAVRGDQVVRDLRIRELAAAQDPDVPAALACGPLRRQGIEATLHVIMRASLDGGAAGPVEAHVPEGFADLERERLAEVVHGNAA